MSIAWPRVMDQNGRPNSKGLDFYKRLLARLKDKGLKTFVTLYHWDLPQIPAGAWRLVEPRDGVRFATTPS